METKYIYKFLTIITMMLCIVIMGIITNANAYAQTNIEPQEKNLEVAVIQKQIEVKTLKQVTTSRNVSYYDINCYTDLSVMNTVTEDQMNEIINYWNSECGGSPFVNKGQIFIEASKQTGLDPVYILAHAGLESAWGNSYYAREYHNYFGIGAFDDDPDNAINYSNSGIDTGIIEGAKWIKENYYNQGQKCLYSMRYNNGYHEYCTSTSWMYSINEIIQISYSLIS